MTSITLTELNQNPSRATRLADHGEVIVMRRGHPAYRITPSLSGSGWLALEFAPRPGRMGVG